MAAVTHYAATKRYDVSRLAIESLSEIALEDATPADMHAVVKRVVDKFVDRPVMFREVEITITVPVGLSARGTRYVPKRVDIDSLPEVTGQLLDRVREGLDEQGGIAESWRKVSAMHAARWILSEMADKISHVLD